MTHSAGVSAVALAVALGMGTIGCASAGYNQPHSAPQGALLGGLAGAGLGAIIGHQSGHTAEGAAIGAATGAAGGYMIGNEQDKTQLQAQSAQALQVANVANTVVINVKNSNGSITPVTLTRQGNMYAGPKGELYTQVPTEDQLRPVYGF